MKHGIASLFQGAWAAAALLAFSSCGAKPKDATPYVWKLPPGFPVPKVPASNPMSQEKVALGRYLFYDKNLSGNQTEACATCHEQAHAFTDTRQRGLGSTGLSTIHNSMSLTNVAYNNVSTWWNPTVTSLELQAQGPMFNTSPPELGLSGLDDVVLTRLRGEPNYPAMFADAFPGESDPFSIANVIAAIASFERTLISGNSPYDKWRYQNGAALSQAAMRGQSLFNSEACECYHCHGGLNFTDDFANEQTTLSAAPYHNTGLFNIGGTGAYPTGDTGKLMITGNPMDMGAFRAPTLRNTAYTAPYYHDGTAETLAQVLANYQHGGREIYWGPDKGNGALSPTKGPFVRGFPEQATVDGVSYTSDEMVTDLLAFLDTLNDPEFVSNPDFSDPNAAR